MVRGNNLKAKRSGRTDVPQDLASLKFRDGFRLLFACPLRRTPIARQSYRQIVLGYEYFAS